MLPHLAIILEDVREHALPGREAVMVNEVMCTLRRMITDGDRRRHVFLDETHRHLRRHHRRRGRHGRDVPPPWRYRE